MPTRFKARAQKRRQPGEMTKTEARYAEVLEALKLSGLIDRWDFEVETFVLGKDCRYTPDFRVVNLPGLDVEFIEVKPANWESIPNQANSRTKIHVAAEMHPYIFSRAVERRKKDGGGFEKTIIEPR